jgi:uncharacterized membrane protein YfcA
VTGAVSLTDAALLVLAGLAAGFVGTVAGLASMVSYPALLAVGLSPVAANVTNTVGITFSGVGSTLGARPELRGQRRAVLSLGVVAVAGGLLGAALLLVTPAEAFEKAVPFLIGGASLAVLTRPRPHRVGDGRDGRRAVVRAVGILLAGLYGGYFGAAAGVMMLALLTWTTPASLARNIALKNVLLFLANTVAACAFVLFGPVEWAAALPLGLGFFAGGRVGPMVVRRAPERPLRLFIAAAGLLVAVRLGLDTYG